MDSLSNDAKLTAVTEKWIKTVVVGLDFCPFARREVERGSVRYRVLEAATVDRCSIALLDELRCMDQDEAVETTLLILPTGQEDFDDYLTLFGTLEQRLEADGYDGTYQLASFHPDYCFADSALDDAANYTNRSPYPMIHILRSSSVEEAIEQHDDTNAIPKRNIEVARELGGDALRTLRDQCWCNDRGDRLDA